MKRIQLSALLGFSLFLAGSLAQAETESASLSFAGCTADAFVAVAGAQNVSIAGHAYAPKCLRVKAGTTVTIDASATHPLQGVGGAVNPIFDDLGGAVSPKTVAFSKPGVYGYYCMRHGDEAGGGMAGAILVE